MVEFACQGCGAKFRLSDDKAGGRGKCPKCGRQFVVPSPASSEKFRAAGASRGTMDLKKALETLGLLPRTTLREARKAWRRLAKQHHPDTGAEKSAVKFLDLVAAYEFLKDHVERRKQATRLPTLSRTTTVAGTSAPIYGLSYGHFVAELDLATRDSIETLRAEKGRFVDRVKTLVGTQIFSYTSASEFRKRVKGDVDAVLQRELWAFIERLGRRCESVDQRFRSWVDQMRASAHEIGLPHSMMEYLARPGGLILSVAIFLVLTSSAYLAMYMSPVPFFDKGPVPILAGILATVTAGLVSLWGGKAMYTGSARKRGIHDRAVLMSQVGLR